MRGPEARRLLTAAGFTISRSTAAIDVYEFDEDIRVPVSKKDKGDDVRTHREVESALRRAAERKKQHEAHHPAHLRKASQVPLPPPEKPLTAKLLSPATVVPPKPPPAPVPPPPPAAPPAEPEDDEEEETTRRKKGELPMEKRIPLQVRVHAMSTKQKIASEDIATILNKEGLRTGSGYEWDTGRINVFVKQHQRLLDLLGAAAPAAVVVPSSLPPYLAALLAEPSLTAEQKAAALRALVPKLPASVDLMMGDELLTGEQKLAILAIVIPRKEGT